MIRLLLAVALTETLLTVTAWAADLSDFVGKTVQDQIGGYKLFDVPKVRKNLIGAFGSGRYQRLSLQMEGTGIKSVRDAELGQGCRPECGWNLVAGSPVT
jgi:hypothetical protein